MIKLGKHSLRGEKWTKVLSLSRNDKQAVKQKLNCEKKGMLVLWKVVMKIISSYSNYTTSGRLAIWLNEINTKCEKIASNVSLY